MERRQAIGRCSDARWSEILEGSAAAFARHGYAQTTIEDIAEEVGLNRATLYYYVENKEDIVRQIIARAIETVEAHAALVRASGPNAAERLRLFVRGYVELMNSEFGRCLLTLRRIPTSRATRAKTAAAYRRIDAVARELLAEGIADGSIRDCDVRVAAFALFGAMNWTPNWFHASEALTAAEAGEAIFEVFARGLTTMSS